MLIHELSLTVVNSIYLAKLMQFTNIHKHLGSLPLSKQQLTSPYFYFCKMLQYLSVHCKQVNKCTFIVVSNVHIFASGRPKCKYIGIFNHSFYIRCSIVHSLPQFIFAITILLILRILLLTNLLDGGCK